MRLGIVGSRRRNSSEDKKIVRKKILELKPDMLVSGGCKQGADRFAEELADELRIPITVFNPRFHSHPKNYFGRVEAYYERNRMIANLSEYLIALVAPDRKGGTENTISHFLKIENAEKLEIL